tara:strand:+ start:133 stop:831 length:699 start_codon:yes stop_codon:yes gene_type:complete
MALPVLETPTFELTLPSTQEIVKYRPFLVKEHKILLSLEKTGAKNIVKTVKDLINVCTFNKLNVDKLPNYDVEYLFLNLRAKSIGELVDVNITCVCDEKIKTLVDLNKIKIENENKINSNIVDLGNNLKAKLRYPNFDEMMDIYENIDTEKVFEVIGKCVDEVHEGNKIHSNFTQEELNTFILSLTKKQFSSIEEFFVNLPKVTYDDEIKCKKPECGNINKIRLEGIEHFFI